MPARDANGATWYMLRYAEDFRPRTRDEATDPSPPRLDDELHYDERRGVLELAPARPKTEAQTPPSHAVDLDGSIYEVDERGQVVVRHCDHPGRRIVCDRGVFARPAGLALDRRGLLYVADPPARRVVVIDTRDGAVRAILHGGALVDPVDVAVAPACGRVYVADRTGGKIVVYSSRLQRAGTLVLPIRDPKPIAIAIAPDGTIVVADARHPRLLRFSADGAQLPDEVLVEAPPPPPPSAPYQRERDAAAYLAEAHRIYRLRALRLARGFEHRGVFISAALDGRAAAVQWHRIVVDADVPPGTSLEIETATAERRESFNPVTTRWQAPHDTRGAIIGITADRREQLIQSPPGRWARLRVTLRGDGSATPTIRSIQVLYPRVSYLASLPRVYARDPAARHFLDQFLALFERRFTGIEDRYEEFSRELNPDAAPRELIDWLACLVDLAFDPSWPLEKRRALVAEAMHLYKTRGTPAGLARFVEIYTGSRPVILEDFLARPPRPVYLGRPGNILGCGVPLASCRTDATPEDQLFCRFAHRFTVLIYLDHRCDQEVTTRVVDRIVTVSKPAHTEHRIISVLPGARVGQDTTVGLGYVVGEHETPRIPLGVDARVLGRSTVL